jgi:prephenate dehydrogenase
MPDESDFSLANCRVAIVGLGLMGGSLALALRNRCAGLYGVDPDPATLELALRQNIVSRADSDPASILPEADLIVFAAPVPAILDYLSRLDDLVPQACIIFDLGSTKQAIVSAMRKLPSRFETIGGHPICGREKLSLENADPTIYQKAPFVLTPAGHTYARASAAVLQIIFALGANPIWMDAALHDRILASTSHLPFLLSSALVMATPENAAPLVGPGFRSSSRLASTSSSMMMGVLQTNRDNILNSISLFRENLDLLEQALQANDFEKVKSILDTANSRHQKFL